MFSSAVSDEDIAFEGVSFQTCSKEDCEATVQAMLLSAGCLSNTYGISLDGVTH